VHDLFKPTPLLRAGFWLLACIVVCCVGWRRSPPREAAFALGVCGSATIYVLSFYAVGVASDFRYGYWAVLAAMAGAVVVWSGDAERTEPRG
jgi:peptidoglycan/LPS O-acetylase OafA/YrhL